MFCSIIITAVLVPGFLLRVSYAAPFRTSSVVSLPLRRATDDDVEKFRKRNSVISDIVNDIQDVPSRYLISVGIGSPWQTDIDLWIDTGSSDTWVFTPESCADADCVRGTFESSQSSTFVNLSIPMHNCLGPGCIDGWYFEDSLTLGDIGIRNFQMGLANSAANYKFGIMGLNGNQGQNYRILPQTLADQGWTQTAAFSIYMDDIRASTGQILFGGYDTSKFTGTMRVFPWDLAWTGLRINDDQGGVLELQSAAFPSKAIIDTGSDKAFIPPDIYGHVASYFNVSCSGQLLCSIADQPGTLDFEIGGILGLEVQVPFSQLTKQRLVNGRLPTDDYGRVLCDFTLGQGSMGSNILGDPFLRNTYTIWDSDRKQIGMAQAIFNASAESANVVEIIPWGNLAGAEHPIELDFANAAPVRSGFCGL